MKNTLIEIFKPTPIELTQEEIEKKIYGRITAGKLQENISNDLKLLELEGKIFYDARTNTYKTFPSNFFITKITSIKDNEFYFKINNKEYNLPNKNNLKKKDTIILEKIHNRFKFVKVLPNIELEKSKNYEDISNLFDTYNKSYSLNTLAKMLNTNDFQTLQNILTSLEEQGKVYFNKDENKYQPFPKRYKVTTIETSKKGFFYIRTKDNLYPLNNKEVEGILPFDKVILEKTKDGFSIIKVLKRNNPNIICEITEKGIRVVGNNNIKVRCNDKEFKDLKLPIGTRILTKIGTKETNKVYDVSFIEVTGHKNDLTSELEAIACNNGFITRYTKEEFFILSSLLLRSMPKAYYSTNNVGHYGLASNAYSQVTSPIRRFMDLIIEYILDHVEDMLDPSFDIKNFKIELEEHAKRASIMERCADKASYESDKLYMVKYVKEHMDETYEGFIQDITPQGIIVKTKDLIEGIIFFEDIDDGLYSYNPECRWLEHKNNKQRFKTIINP